jgi:hypothetical protein
LTDYPQSRTNPLALAVLKRAELCGTLNQVKRAPQYRGEEYTKPEKLLEAVNAAGDLARGVQADLGKVQNHLYNLKLRNSLIVASVTAALMRAPEIWAWLVRLWN